MDLQQPTTNVQLEREGIDGLLTFIRSVQNLDVADDFETVCLPQSGPETSQHTITSQMEKQQNITFYDNTSEYKLAVDNVMDRTRMTQDKADATLGSFLSRPLLIKTIKWDTGTIPYELFNPWDLFFSNARIANRLTNFHLLRCRLHVKIVVNGNAFQYGRAMAAYLPLDAYDNQTRLAGTPFENIVQLSQLPHIFINPTQSMGGEMILPFFWHKNSLLIPENEWENMGTMVITPFNALRHASDATDSCNISIYAWAEDVTVAGLTSSHVQDLTPQSGLEDKDETDVANKHGVVSSAATHISGAAMKMSVIPKIKPYALATANVANGVAHMAKIFGYSRPNMTKTPEPYKPAISSSLATTTTPDSVQKLTVDDKQELSIDPRIAGLGDTDSLDINHIAMRETFIGKYPWLVSDTTEKILFQASVQPTYSVSNAILGGYYLPAITAAAAPFEKWTGSIRYRFQIVCSSFHKGRVRVVYDPDTPTVDPDQNVQYSEVIDIAERMDFTITVANAQEKTWLTRHRLNTPESSLFFGGSLVAASDVGNGYLSLVVLNPLTVPSSDTPQDIEINVFVSAGEDFEVTEPGEEFARYTFGAQSGVESMVASPTTVDASDLNAPFRDPKTETSLGHDKVDLDDEYKVFYGEAIKSFRPLLKRYTLHECISRINSTNSVIAMSNTRSMFPFLRGYVPGAVHLTSLVDPYNYCNTLLLHWVTMMHQGWRGSIRYKVIPRIHGNQVLDNSVERYQFNQFGPRHYSAEINTTALGGISAGAEEGVIRSNKRNAPGGRRPQYGALGLARVTSKVNPVLEFEVPYYSNYRFYPGKQDDYTSTVTSDLRLDLPGWHMTTYTEGSNRSKLDIYASAGEDFQVYFFTGMPVVFYEADPPAPSAT